MDENTGNIQAITRSPFSHRIRVRHGDYGAHGDVHGATYLAYVEDAVARWFDDALSTDWHARIQCIPRNATLQWADRATAGDTLSFTLRVEEWRSTGLTLAVSGWKGSNLAVEATVAYDFVEPVGGDALPVPVQVKHALTAALLGL